MKLSGQLNLDKILQYNLPNAQYFREENVKTQIVLHHSAGWDNARGMFAGWAADKQRVATCMGIVDDGTMFQCFSSKYWAWHVNFLSRGNRAIKLHPELREFCNLEYAQAIEERTVAVEICNWGPLHYDESGIFKTWAGVSFKDEKKIINYEHGFRGFNFYERYTDAEIECLWRLLRHWCHRYDIPKKYNPDMWDLSVRAVAGVLGVWAHCSYRTDKSDLHPQPEIIEMLKSL